MDPSHRETKTMERFNFSPKTFALVTKPYDLT